MKKAYIGVRILLGIIFLFSSTTYLFKLITPPEPVGTMKIFSDGIKASVYLMPMVKIIELTCSLAFLSGRFVSLAVLLIWPVIVNIFFVHTFLGPEGLPVAIFLVLSNSFLTFYYRERYKEIIKM